MANILKLTNKTRALLRAPLRPSIPVSAALLAELLPIVKKPVAAQKKAAVKKPAGTNRSAAQNRTAAKNDQPARTSQVSSGFSSHQDNGKPANQRVDAPRPVDKPVIPPVKPSLPVEKRGPSITTPRNPYTNGSASKSYPQDPFELKKPAASASTRPAETPKPGESAKPVEQKPVEGKPAAEKPSAENIPAEKPAAATQNPTVPPVNGKPSSNGNGKVGSGIPPARENGQGKNGYSHQSPLFRSGSPSGARNEHPLQRNTPRPGPLSQPPLQVPEPPANGAKNGHPNGFQNGSQNGNGKVQPPAAGASSTPASAAASNHAPSSASSVPATGVRKPPASRAPDLLAGLDGLFQAQPGLPAQSAVLGVCDDGFPVLLDLNDPTPGGLVVIGDERQEQLDVLRSAVASIVKRNSPRSVQILVVSCDPKLWRQWISANGYDRYFIGVEGVEDLDSLSEWILRLGDWTEQRRQGERSGPPILLVMDTLSFMTRLDYNVRLNFEWMVKEGPPAQIWPLAAISTDLALSLNSRRLLRSFRTRVLGFADDAAFYQNLVNMPEKEAQEFGEPGVFAVQIGETWLRFRLPGR